MLWSNKEDKKAWDCIETYMGCRFEIPKDNVSALYTWQDTRCERSFLDTLPVPQCHLPTYSGYGCATLFWIMRNRWGTPWSLIRHVPISSLNTFPVIRDMLGDPLIPSNGSAVVWMCGHSECSYVGTILGNPHLWPFDSFVVSQFITACYNFLINQDASV
jgi:sedoheptulokinase